MNSQCAHIFITIDEDSSDIPRTRIFHKRTMKKTLKICSIIAMLFVLTNGKPSKIFSKKEQPKNVQKKSIEYKSLYQDIQSLSEKIGKAEENLKDSDVSLQEKNYWLAMREGFGIFYSAAQNFFSKGPPPPENSIGGNGSAILKANNSEIHYNNVYLPAGDEKYAWRNCEAEVTSVGQNQL